MPELTLNPRFAETDALGHINNTAIAAWFESARQPIFRVFHPDLAVADWSLVLRRTEYDFLAQMYYGHDVTIRTAITRIGDSSMIIEHEAWQRDALAVRGRVVLIHFDRNTGKKKSIPEPLRAELAALG